MGAAVLALCCCGLVLLVSGRDDPEGDSEEPDRQVSPGTPGSPPRVAPPSSPTGDEPDNGGGGGGIPPGDCAAYVDSEDWCVDGIGDYDCEGGSGDGPNYAPRGVRLVDPKVDPFGLDRDGDGVGCEGSGRPPAPAPPPPPPPDPGTDPRFSTCREAKAAGYGPYYRGKDPEYHWYRDADNDGVVCE